jgi:hypothetical protein
VRKDRMASLTVKPVKLHYAQFNSAVCFDVIFFQTPGSLCKEYYSFIYNIASVYHIVAMRVI